MTINAHAHLTIEAVSALAGRKLAADILQVWSELRRLREAAGAIVLQAAVKEGTTVMLHQRNQDIIVGDVKRMADRLKRRLAGRQPLAAMGFECRARTGPYLGKLATQQEHDLLRSQLAPLSPWLGMMAWGEITPMGRGSSFCNYTYPLLAFAQEPQP